ncbi:hypothetical protein GCM10010112_83680 [Actinoplanes lobatus]|uniref:Uncharacterized protein n=1 Tax=Actinoplanes lobatus TaxID=113568 RepID=A0ABQ4AYW3_9ACTN|nr:hypothetical protein GCM10010112_83680 [Actinoplanes lobatus]GIE46010.1 hypothetical protein Alo02nite_89080 [Actinoplanes lobatus]
MLPEVWLHRWLVAPLQSHSWALAPLVAPVLELSDNEDVRWLAQIMLNGQQTEIATLQEMLDRNSTKPL